MRDNPSRLSAAIFTLFRPIASLLLRQGVNANTAIEILRTAFVRSAIDEFGKNGKPASISAAARITGLSRKSVSDLKDRSWKVKETHIAKEGSILAEWVHGEAYLDHLGRPRDLAIKPGPGTFSSLVKDATGEDSYLLYLDRLCEVGCVQSNEDETVRMIRREFRIDKDLSLLLSGALAMLAKSIAYNWTRPPGEGYCIRLAHSGSIDPTKVMALRRMSRDKIVNFVEEIDDVLLSSETEALENSEESDIGVIGVGAYYYEFENDSD